MTKNRAHKPTMRWLWLMAASLALVLCLMPQPASAQAVTGTILGTVKDSSGAVVVGAKVKLTQIEMGIAREVVSDARGEYTVPLLPTGTYNIVCEMTGFKGVTLANVRLRVDQKVRMDLTLEVGVITDAITIQADTPLISTNTSDLSATINETQIKTLPITNRNFVFLARTIPGVGRGTAGDNIDGSAGSYGWRNTAAFTANGQRTRDNNFMLDGVDNNEQWLNTVVIFPNVDALEEFKVQTSTYSAEFGKSLGGVVNLQTKSGTNTFHGSAYEFLRNDKLDANDWFNNKFGRARPDFSQHQFGGTLSGPLIQNKTFFFADYQGWRANQDLTMISTVPTARMRQGDFSELNRKIFDPFSPGTQFAGNVLPTDRMDAAALRILGLYPAPNADGSKAASGQTINNYISNPTMERKDDQADLKIDHILSPRNRMFARLSYEKSYRLLPGALPDHGDAGSNVAGVGSAGIGNIKAWSLALNDTHSFSDKLINEFRLGWNSIEINAEPIDYRSNTAQAMGVPGINLSEVSSSMMMVSFIPCCPHHLWPLCTRTRPRRPFPISGRPPSHPGHPTAAVRPRWPESHAHSGHLRQMAAPHPRPPLLPTPATPPPHPARAVDNLQAPSARAQNARMRPPSELPPHLRNQPFTVAEARTAGVGRRRTRARDLVSPCYGVRATAATPDSLLERVHALTAVTGAIVSHLSAAVLVGISPAAGLGEPGCHPSDESAGPAGGAT